MDDDDFVLIGKALFLAQKFEMTCKDILAWILAAQRLSESAGPTLEEFASHSDELRRLFLKPIIKLANAKLQRLMTKANYQVLDDGVKGRNWIAHECCENMIEANLNRRDPALDRGLLLQHFKNMATADALVSKWSFEFHEREPATMFFKQKYIDGIVDWVTL